MIADFRWTPFKTVFSREIKRFYKVVVQTIVAPIVSSLLYLLVFGVSLGKSIQMEGELTYLGFLIPGLVMMGCLNNCFQNTASSVVSSKFSGDVEDYVVSPLGHQQLIWAMCLGGLVRGILVSFITFSVGQVFHFQMFGSFLPVAHPFVLIFFLIVGGMSFAMIGIFVAIYSKSVDQLSAFSSFILLPLIYLGGVFFSLKTLHPIWQTVSKFNPLLYFINGVRYGILGEADVSLSMAAGIALLSLLLCNYLAVRSFNSGVFQRW